MRDNAIRVGFFALLVLLWDGVVRLGVWPDYLFPGPGEVFEALRLGIADRTFLNAVGTSLSRFVIGFSAALIIGIGLGLAIGSLRVVRETVGPLMIGLQSLPNIAWLPMGLLWFGLNDGAILFVIVMGVVNSVAMSTADGIRNVPPIYRRAARTMGAGGVTLYVNVVLPAALPSIMTGIKIGWTFGWHAIIAGEMLFVSLGLGAELVKGREIADMPRVMAVMLIIVLLGLAMERLVFSPLEHRVRRRWGLERA
ncbi:MAG: ABC transporter permease [Nitrospirota bacterium]